MQNRSTEWHVTQEGPNFYTVFTWMFGIWMWNVSAVGGKWLPIHNADANAKEYEMIWKKFSCQSCVETQTKQCVHRPKWDASDAMTRDKTIHFENGFKIGIVIIGFKTEFAIDDFEIGIVLEQFSQVGWRMKECPRISYEMKRWSGEGEGCGWDNDLYSFRIVVSVKF